MNNKTTILTIIYFASLTVFGPPLPLVSIASASPSMLPLSGDGEEDCNGISGGTAVTDPCGVCVAEIPVEPYTSYGNKTICDNESGLLWQQTDQASYQLYIFAESFCEDLNLGDYDDWRVPSLDELVNLVVCTNGLDQYDRCNDGSLLPTLDVVFDCKPMGYWASDMLIGDTGVTYRKYVNFGKGSASHTLAAAEYPNGKYVRCVRGESIP